MLCSLKNSFAAWQKWQVGVLYMMTCIESYSYMTLSYTLNKKYTRILWCVYSTKSEPIFKIGNVSHARSAWWLETKSYAPRKPRHPLASLGNPKKKKCSLLFCFSRGGFFLKWKGHFSFWGSTRKDIRAVWRDN